MTIEFKIWAYKSHEVYWEFRRPAMALHATLPQSFDLNRFIKSNWPSWQANFARMGCGDATVKPSEKVARYWGEEFLTDEFVRQEFSITTRG